MRKVHKRTSTNGFARNYWYAACEGTTSKFFKHLPVMRYKWYLVTCKNCLKLK